MAVQIVDDGSGSHRVAPDPLLRSLGDATGAQADAPPERISPLRVREQARIRTLAAPGARVSLTIAPASLAPWLASIGATAIERSKVVDDVRAEIPAERIEELLARPELRRVAAAASARPTASWSGLRMQDALGSVRLRAVGLDGGHGGRTAGGLKIGIVEVAADLGNWPVADHPGWNGRLVAVRDCRFAGCPVATPLPVPSTDTFSTTHGTAVAWVAAGSIEGGQDPAFPGQATSEQRARSGHLGAATLVFYGTNGSDAVARAIDRAVEDGMDVVNMSLVIGDATTWCDPHFDPSGITAHMRAALDAGVTLVASAGNDGGAGGCTVGFPAFRPEVLSIGALGSADDSASYEELPIWNEGAGVGSARGRIDLVAPGCLAGFFTGSSGLGDGYFLGPGGPCGTSLAAPAGSALVGALRGALASLGAPLDDGRSMLALALLLGDGWDPEADDGRSRRSGMSALSGAGRAHARWPGDGGSPSGWGFRTITIHQGETVTWRVGRAGSRAAAGASWRWAVAQTPSSVDDVPAIELHVDDTCSGTTLASDTSHGTRARFGLQADVRCLRMRAYGARIPAGGATFYSADAYEARAASATAEAR
jgi:hypothetical protein